MFLLSYNYSLLIIVFPYSFPPLRQAPPVIVGQPIEWPARKSALLTIPVSHDSTLNNTETLKMVETCESTMDELTL